MEEQNQNGLEECISKIMEESPLNEIKAECQKCNGYDKKCEEYLPIKKMPIG